MSWVTLAEEFSDVTDRRDGRRPTRGHTLNEFSHTVYVRPLTNDRDSDSFGEQNLRSFLNLLVFWTQDYDVALMNPPYGSRNRMMPNGVKQYVDSNYEYYPEYYINFVEVCDRMSKENGRMGCWSPVVHVQRKGRDIQNGFWWDWVASISWPSFRVDGWMRWLALSGLSSGLVGPEFGGRTFIRLMRTAKENLPLFIRHSSNTHDGVKRRYTVNLSDFSLFQGITICYSIPDEVRESTTR